MHSDCPQQHPPRQPISIARPDTCMQDEVLGARNSGQEDPPEQQPESTQAAFVDELAIVPPVEHEAGQLDDGNQLVMDADDTADADSPRIASPAEVDSISQVGDRFVVHD